MIIKEKEEIPTWRYGRAYFGKWDLGWNLFHDVHLIDIELEKGGYNHDRITFKCWLKWFGFYIGREFNTTFEHKEIGIAWNTDSIIISPWINTWDGVCYSDPWYKRAIWLHVKDWICGKDKYSCEQGEKYELIIPLPEGCYKATATPEKRVWTNRFRTLIRRSVSLDIEGGIPFSGKGENSWDCGDDGLWGCEGETEEEAIANAVKSVLRNRKRYGLDSKNTGSIPLKVINE